MVQVIMGAKGSGKTKQLIELINKATDSERGSVICIESASEMTFNLNNQVRLINSSEFHPKDFTFLKGFVSGLYASNYDVTHVFMDSLSKIVPCAPTSPEVEDFLQWLDAFGKKNNIRFTLTLSADLSLATDMIKSYF